MSFKLIWVCVYGICVILMVLDGFYGNLEYDDVDGLNKLFFLRFESFFLDDYEWVWMMEYFMSKFNLFVIY